MSKQYSRFCVLTIVMFGVLMISSDAFAQKDYQFMNQLHSWQMHRVQMEKRLGLDPMASSYPHATCYYDDKEDHYEQVWLMSDFIDRGIR